MNSINEVDKPMVKKTVVVYAGRFQPFHKGHYAAYSKLVSKFGVDSVYIGTSNDQSNEKSPFNFKEKKLIATKMFGIPSSKFVQIKNPYKPVEILKKFDGQTTQYIAAVGEKDATRLQGNYFKAYNGKAGYGYDEIGYVYPVPAESNPISGTDVRNGLGSGDVEKAKKFFLKAYPKFDKDIFKLITGKLMKENFPGGIGVGLTLPGGYINGAPKRKDVDKLSKTIHTKDDNDTNKDYLYDPIGEIISGFLAEEIFNEFVENYLGEAPNAALDKDITYTNTKGKQKKIKARDALRLKKDHPAHIQAAKLVGVDSEPTTTGTNKKPDLTIPGQKAGTVVKKGDGKPDLTMPGNKKKDTDTTGAPPAAPLPQKLSGKDLKSAAETGPKDEKTEKVKQALDDARKNLSAEDNESIDKANDPKSKERGGFINAMKKAGSYIGHGVMHVLKHNAEMIGGTGSAIKSLATTGKMGSIKDKNGKNVHWGDYTESDSASDSWGSKMQEVPVYKKDKHGHDVVGDDGKKIQDKNWLGKPKTKKVPKFREDLSDDEKQLAEKSWKEHEKQKKAVIGLAKTTALIVGSIVATGAIMGGAAAAAKGAGIGGIAKGAAAKVAYKFTGGHLGTYVLKDIAKHSALEALGANAGQATTGGVALGVAGIFENKNDKEFDTEKFVPNYINKTLEVMQNYKLSDEQLLKVIEKYKTEGPKTAAADLLKEDISKTKKQSIQHFVEWATKRLKLSETPKIVLISGKGFANQKSSLGGYSPETKEIYVAIEGRLSADIIRTIAHEMVHRKQDEMGLIKDSVKDGADGSEVENKANSVAGILLREYGRLNKQIYTENKKTINEVSALSYGDDDEANGAWLPKGATRKLGGNDGSNKTDDWYKNGGYTQTQFPKADAIFGDEDADIFTVKYSSKNLPKWNSAVTEFPDAEIPKPVLSEMGKGDIHLKNIINKYKDKTFRKRINAYLFGKPNYNNYNEVAKTLRNMDYSDITQMEKDLNLHNPDLDEKIEVDVNTGDTVLMGKFKNKKVDIKNIGKDQHGMPTINGKQATTFRTMNEELLMEGGAYGHMSHPFDDMDLTFGQLKDIIIKALDGELGVVREKTDGQALAISWKNGRLIAARNKGHLANAGENAMGIGDVASKFAGRGGLTDAYNFAMKDLSVAIDGLSQKQKEKIFNEGKCFMNIEVIWPESVNVIPYGQALLIFHNTTCYNENGEAISADQSSARMLAGMIKQVNADVQSKYTIQGPPITEIPKTQKLSSKKAGWISKLAKLQSQFGCTDSDTMAVYHQHWWENFINKNAPVKVDKLTKDALIRRWAFGDKSLRLNTISNKELQDWASKSDKVDVIKQQKDNMKKFEEIFLGVGADILEFVGSVLTVHPNKAIRSMKDRLKQVASQVKVSTDASKILKFKNELQRLNSLGGIDRIVASEGLVFFYNGKTYKLTGTFAPLNQLLGIFYQ
jgi:hypothetical protein